VLLIGRKLNNSTDLPAWPFKTSRMNLLVNKGPLFYMLFNCNLFFKLLFKKCDLLYANDLDTLLPNYLISRIKRIPIIYDSHELFCEVPELKSSPLKRKIWLSVEGWIVPKLKNCISVDWTKDQSYSLIYFDGNHSKQATLDYFELLLPTITNDSVWIFDDIHWSTGMEEAWEIIKSHPKVKVTIDTFQWGIVFFRSEQEKEHFTIRA